MPADDLRPAVHALMGRARADLAISPTPDGSTCVEGSAPGPPALAARRLGSAED